MKRILFVAAAGAAALLSACATPETTAAATQQATVGPDGEPLICRRIKETGTRFSEKVCKTADAWESFDKYTNGNAKESTDRMQRLNTGGATSAGG